MPDEQMNADVSLDVAGQKVNLRNIRSVNTIVTVLTLFVVLSIGFLMFEHRTDTKEMSSSFVSAIKEQTTAIREQTAAQREQTCLYKFAESERRANSEWCRQVSGAPAHRRSIE